MSSELILEIRTNTEFDLFYPYEDRLEDEILYESDMGNNHFRVPVIIKNSEGDMVLLFGGVHLEKMMHENGSCKVWIIKRERWKE